MAEHTDPVVVVGGIDTHSDFHRATPVVPRAVDVSQRRDHWLRPWRALDGACAALARNERGDWIDSVVWARRPELWQNR